MLHHVRRALPWAMEDIGLSARCCLCIKIFNALRLLTKIFKIIFKLNLFSSVWAVDIVEQEPVTLFLGVDCIKMFNIPVESVTGI